VPSLQREEYWYYREIIFNMASSEHVFDSCVLRFWVGGTESDKHSVVVFSCDSIETKVEFIAQCQLGLYLQ
jgi:hypothetical protein